MSGPYQYVYVAAFRRPMDEVLTDEHADGVKREARLANSAPVLLDALRAILFQVNQGKVLERDACIAQARAAYIQATREEP
jgi:hypothetical protein